MTVSPLTLYPDKTIVLSPAYFGQVSRYALIASVGHASVDTGAKFDKRLKSTRRMTIADVNGPMNLTVPILKPESLTRARWNDIRLSTHGEWWHVHRVALESAYGRTPFFEFYIDRFLRFISRTTVDTFQRLTSLDEAIEREICGILDIPSPVYTDSSPEGEDCRGNRCPTLPDIPYYQVRQNDFGFLGGLSVLDLIFNVGPESPLVLRKMTE